MLFTASLITITIIFWREVQPSIRWMGQRVVWRVEAVRPEAGRGLRGTSNTSSTCSWSGWLGPACSTPVCRISQVSNSDFERSRHKELGPTTSSNIVTVLCIKLLPLLENFDWNKESNYLVMITLRLISPFCYCSIERLVKRQERAKLCFLVKIKWRSYSCP